MYRDWPHVLVNQLNQHSSWLPSIVILNHLIVFFSIRKKKECLTNLSEWQIESISNPDVETRKKNFQKKRESVNWFDNIWRSQSIRYDWLFLLSCFSKRKHEQQSCHFHSPLGWSLSPESTLGSCPFSFFYIYNIVSQICPSSHAILPYLYSQRRLLPAG